jgi:L-2-amino-thiazoline-4-carboxylic acid hydrolase-like protein
MGVFSSLLFCVPSLAFRRAAAPRLAASFPAGDAEHIWRKTLKLQSELKAKRPRHSFGVNLMLRYLEWDCALYRALQEHGMARSQAGGFIEEVNWNIFGPVTASSFKISRARSSKLQIRIRWILDTMFFVLFTSPFQRRVLPSDDGVAFDVVACPFSAYLRDQGVPDLTAYAACSLDHRMARQWGVRLDRSQTIAEGAPLCDFRFKSNSSD